MATAAQVVRENSTTVRAKALRLRLLRMGLRGAEVVAPEAADRYAASLFFRPRRGARRAAPALAGHAGRAFTVSSGDAELAAFSWGDGPTVLLVHGWEGHAGQLMAFAEPLVARGYRVVTFDMPGHGRSTGTRSSALDMALAVRDVARETAPLVGTDGAPLHAIVAHSLGGAATTRALRDGLTARRVVLLAPAAEPTFFARRAAAFMGLSPARTQGMIDQVIAELGGDVMEVDARCIAPSLSAQALVFHDEQDSDVPFAHGEAIARAWPSGVLVPLAGLGHRRLLRDARVVERAVSFIDGNRDWQSPSDRLM